VIYRSLEQIFEDKERIFHSLMTTLLPLSATQANARMAEGQWTITEVAEHLHIVESRLYKLVNVASHRLEKSVKQPPDDCNLSIGLPDEAESKTFMKVKTKKEYEPTGTVSIAESMARLKVIHDDLNALHPRLERINLSAAAFDHWLLGSLTLGQWVAFIGIHEERHLRQIQSIVASERFPDH
jgi:hypothetical protein